MATTPTPLPSTPRRTRKPAAPKTEKHTLTITFEGKYESLYNDLVTAAQEDDRSVSQYVLLFLRDNHKVNSTE